MHHFIMEAVFQVMLHMFMENTSHDPIAESVKQQLLDSQSPHSIETMVATLKMSQSSEYKHFITYLRIVRTGNFGPSSFYEMV